MSTAPSTRAARVLLAPFLSALLAVACATPEGPRLPLPDQSADAQPPEGYARLVFFHRPSPVGVCFPVDIWLDGNSAPSIARGEYVQLFVEPGSYELLLEHFDILVTWSDVYVLEVVAPETHVQVMCRPISTVYERVDGPPPDAGLFRPIDDAHEWPVFSPGSAAP